MASICNLARGEAKHHQSITLPLSPAICSRIAKQYCCSSVWLLEYYTIHIDNSSTSSRLIARRRTLLAGSSRCAWSSSSSNVHEHHHGHRTVRRRYREFHQLHQSLTRKSSPILEGREENLSYVCTKMLTITSISGKQPQPRKGHQCLFRKPRRRPL